MTQDEIIAMALKAGMAPHLGHTDDDGNHHPAVNALKRSVPVEWLERFAALVAAAEREAMKPAIISALNEYTREMENYSYFGSNPGVQKDDYEDVAEAAAAIRKRGAA